MSRPREERVRDAIDQTARTVHDQHRRAGLDTTFDECRARVARVRLRDERSQDNR